jgi:type I restriction enzyme R subunit
MTNFDFLYSQAAFSSFAGASVAAEKIFPIDAAACAVNIRRAAELAVKWMYASDTSLPTPRRDQLSNLIGATAFRTLVGPELSRGLEYIRKTGNNAAHNPGSLTKEQAELALRSLYAFACFLMEKYGSRPHKAAFDPTLLDPDAELVTEAMDSGDIRRLVKENRTMKRILNTRDREASPEKSGQSLSEAETRRLYVESALAYAGWKMGEDCFSEFRVTGMPGESGIGYADYVLCDTAGTPMAVVEAQAAGDDPAIGRQQAKLYADGLEKRFGVRPAIFLTNGFDTRVWFDRKLPETRISGFYSPADLARVAEIEKNAKTPRQEDIASCIADRPYQKAAVRAVTDALCIRRERNLFLSMAPGTGKTRTALAAAEVLIRCGQAKHILFLTESDLLAEQSRQECAASLPGIGAYSLTDLPKAVGCSIVFATFEDVLAEADDLVDDGGIHILSAGRFDLVICDETDTALARKYETVFSAFHAPRLMLTSVAAEEIDPALCDILDTPHTSPVFTFPLKDAVGGGWLASPEMHGVRLQSFTAGFIINRLEDRDLRTLKKHFSSPEDVPVRIAPEEMFTKYYNENTVKRVLTLLQDSGRRDPKTGLLAKTVLFTRNHAHSEMIYEMWGKLYPDTPPHFCRVMDSDTNYAHALLQEFADPDAMPRIAISHDLLTDGVNIPSVKNLVFFTPAPSRTKFWRMLGRGMRRTAYKTSFHVLDVCGNLDAFVSESDPGLGETLPLHTRLFRLKIDLIAALQGLSHTSDAPLREILVRDVCRRIRSLDRDSFAVRRHLSAVDRFSSEDSMEALRAGDIQMLTHEIAPLMLEDGTPFHAALFDGQMYALMLARAEGKDVSDTVEILTRRVRMLSRMGSHEKISRQKKYIHRILFNGDLEKAPLKDLETARRALSPLMRYVAEEEDRPLYVNIEDPVLAETFLPDPFM